MIYTTAN